MRRICVVFLLLGSLSIAGQNFDKNSFYEADMEVVSGEHEKALRIFERLLRSEPDNPNLNFLTGLCLINIPGRKIEALPYLEKAAPYATTEYKYGSPRETNAPIEVIKYYAMVCKLTDDIPKAIDLLKQYKSLLKSKERDEIALTDKMLESCYTAQRLQQSPVFFNTYDLGAYLSSEDLILNPVVNRNEDMLFYAVPGKYDRSDIYFCKKEGGLWTEPVKISTTLGVKSECLPTAVSGDNQRLYLTVINGDDADAYYTEYANNKWRKMVKMGKTINGKGQDGYASESADGRYLYFASDRKGGMGKLDLWRAEQDGSGGWEKPVNLGEMVNTTENELMPVMNSSDTKLFFKSEGHENMGGYDIFVTEKTGDSRWGPVTNLGYPINTADDDLNFQPVGEGNYAYKTTRVASGGTQNQISYIEIFSADNPRNFEISGFVTLENSSTDYQDVNIEVYNTSDYSSVTSAQPDPYSGNFSFSLTGGNYMVNFSKPGFLTYTHLLDIPVNSPDKPQPIYAMLQEDVPVVEETTPEETEKLVEETVEKDYSSYMTEEPAYDTQENVYESSAATETAYAETTTSGTSYYDPAKDYSGKYTVQFMASTVNTERVSLGDEYPIEIQKGTDRYFRYITGVFNSLEEAEQVQKELSRTRYKNSFIRYYNLDDYLNKPRGSTFALYTIQVMAGKYQVDPGSLKGLEDLHISYGSDGYYRYTSGEFGTMASARRALKKVHETGYENAYIQRISEISNY